MFDAEAKKNINFLMENEFANLSDISRSKIIELGRYVPAKEDLHLKQKDGNRTRQLNSNNFSKITWLTYATKKNCLLCFPCLIFCVKNCRDQIWCKRGFTNLKNLHARCKKHEISKEHLKNQVKLASYDRTNIKIYLSDAYKTRVSNHNEAVSKNRYILKRLIGSVTYLIKQELPLRGHDETRVSNNQGNYRELLNLHGEFDEILQTHLSNNSSFKGTSSHIQNEIISCIYKVVHSYFLDQLNVVNYVGIQVDETPDVSNHEQCSIILRYVHKDEVFERFAGFYRVLDRRASGIASVIFNLCDELKITAKIISQTYDGARVMAGSLNGVKQIVKTRCPNAHFIHCYAHKLNLVIQQVCSSIGKVKLFFASVMAIQNFSPLRQRDQTYLKL